MKRQTYTHWRPEDVQFLIWNGAELSSTEIVLALGGRYTRRAVESKWRRLKLHKSPDRIRRCAHQARAMANGYRCGDCGSLNLVRYQELKPLEPVLHPVKRLLDPICLDLGLTLAGSGDVFAVDHERNNDDDS